MSKYKFHMRIKKKVLANDFRLFFKSLNLRTIYEEYYITFLILITRKKFQKYKNDKINF